MACRVRGPARPPAPAPLALLLAAAACCPAAAAFVAEPGTAPPRGLPGTLKRWGAPVPSPLASAQAGSTATAVWWGLPQSPPWYRRAAELAGIYHGALVLGVACAALALQLGQGRLLGPPGVGPAALFKLGAARPAAKLAAFDASVLRWAKTQQHPAQQSNVSAAQLGLGGKPAGSAGPQEAAERPCERAASALGPVAASPGQPVDAGADAPLKDAFRVSLLRAALGLLRQRNLEASQAAAVAAAAAAPP